MQQATVLDQDFLDLLVTCQQPLLSSFPASSPTRVQPEPTSSSQNSAMVAGVVAALVVALIVIIIVVVIAYFLYK